MMPEQRLTGKKVIAAAAGEVAYSNPKGRQVEKPALCAEEYARRRT